MVRPPTCLRIRIIAYFLRQYWTWPDRRGAKEPSHGSFTDPALEERLLVRY